LLQRLDVEELKQFARAHGFSIAPSERAQFKILSDTLIDVLDTLDAREAAPITILEALRDPGRPPSPGEDPYNAIVRWCRVKADTSGILSGKRVSVKDSVGVAGVPLTCGSRVLSGFVPASDSVVAERVLLAGGEIAASTNMDDFALSAGGESSFYGPTLNPFDSSRTAGGSSGGAAAALHYDGIDLSIGCDQGGSIRVPAAWCGVIGLKPTYGLVPYTGIVGIDQTIDHAGPMGRSSADVAALLQAIAGKDESDPRQREVPARDYVRAVAQAPDTLAGVTLGVVTEAFSEEARVQPAVAESVKDALDRLAGLGARIVRISIPEHLQAGGASFATAIQGMTDLLESGGNGFGWKGRYSGHPALTIPAAETDGLPVGVMLIGQHFADDRLLSLAAAYERHYGWLPGASQDGRRCADGAPLPVSGGPADRSHTCSDPGVTGSAAGLRRAFARRQQRSRNPVLRAADRPDRRDSSSTETDIADRVTRRDVTVSNQTPVSSLAGHILGGLVPAGRSRQGERQREHRPGITVRPI